MWTSWATQSATTPLHQEQIPSYNILVKPHSQICLIMTPICVTNFLIKIHPLAILYSVQPAPNSTYTEVHLKRPISMGKEELLGLDKCLSD